MGGGDSERALSQYNAAARVASDTAQMQWQRPTPPTFKPSSGQRADRPLVDVALARRSLLSVELTGGCSIHELSSSCLCHTWTLGWGSVLRCVFAPASQLRRRPVLPAGSAPSNNRAVRLVAPAGKAKDMGDGVLPGIASWPPKPITEHGQPKPEDDPANFEGTNIVDLCATLTTARAATMSIPLVCRP